MFGVVASALVCWLFVVVCVCFYVWFTLIVLFIYVCGGFTLSFDLRFVFVIWLCFVCCVVYYVVFNLCLVIDLCYCIWFCC